MAWAAVAAVVGAVVGLAGTFWLAAWLDDASAGASYPRLASLAALFGKQSTILSVLGVLALAGGGPRAASRTARVVGVALISLFFVPFVTIVALEFGWISIGMGGPSFLVSVLIFADLVLPGVVVIPFAVMALLSREIRVGTILIGLCVFNLPFLLVWQVVSDGEFGQIPEPAAAFVLLGGLGAGVSLFAAPLWVILGVVLLRRARERALGEVFRVREKENLNAARRLYGEGLARGDASVLDELVSEDFRDLRSGARGKLAMERVFAALWKSYPDLCVETHGQEAEGDVVRTRLLLSGTDEGGVLWYPPTGRRAAFAVEFVDRFSEGRLIAHSGETDTENLLRQLGLRNET